jgi:endonuclease/exonuclease/phosphatase family metal-dependent hydrolase
MSFFLLFAQTTIYGDMSLSVVTLNSFASIPEPIRYNGLTVRATHFGQAFYHSIGKDVDIICLQELSYKKPEILDNFTEHKYHTPILTSSLFGAKACLQESGLAILSRYPIQKIYGMIFNGPTYQAEWVCAKGALLVKIGIPGFDYVYVMNIHLNAWTDKRAEHARDYQIKQIVKWLIKLDIDFSHPLIITGDWNIDAYEHSAILNKLMNQLHATLFMPPTTQFSFDPQNNPLPGLDAPDEYSTLSRKGGCVDEYLTRGTCTCCPRQLVDLICMSKNHLLPVTTSLSVIPVKYPSAFPIKVRMGITRHIKHVSDHSAVVLRCTFENNKDIKFKIPTQGGEHATEIEYDVPYYDFEWIGLQLILSLLFGLLLFFLIRWYHLYRTKLNRRS